ncbi:unnamed protein product [Amoebophrya sp. A25]|nr:unnamed protein product [Amoebophrya sp. A25]|eukprot:GSA25T00025287001.1
MASSPSSAPRSPTRARLTLPWVPPEAVETTKGSSALSLLQSNSRSFQWFCAWYVQTYDNAEGQKFIAQQCNAGSAASGGSGGRYRVGGTRWKSRYENDQASTSDTERATNRPPILEQRSVSRDEEVAAGATLDSVRFVSVLRAVAPAGTTITESEFLQLYALFGGDLHGLFDSVKFLAAVIDGTEPTLRLYLAHNAADLFRRLSKKRAEVVEARTGRCVPSVNWGDFITVLEALVGADGSVINRLRHKIATGGSSTASGTAKTSSSATANQLSGGLSLVHVLSRRSVYLTEAEFVRGLDLGVDLFMQEAQDSCSLDMDLRGDRGGPRTTYHGEPRGRPERGRGPKSVACSIL